MSQKDQEAAIDERIERIRKRNEEIQRRYLEVEADKLNAEKLNAAVKFSPSPAKNPIPERKNYTRPQPINKNPRFERKILDKPYVAKHQVHGNKSSFAENDGPPPDPVYTFLSDSSRDAPKVDHSSDENITKENFSSEEFRGSRGGGRGRGWSRGRGNPSRGGKRGPGNQPSRQSPQMQPDYQAWRAEREKIDQDRITRQKTAEGNWRREWDSKKLSQDENQEYPSRPVFSKKKKREDEEFKIQRTVVNELAVSSPPPKEHDVKGSDKCSMTKINVKRPSTEKKTVAFKVNDGPSVENDEVEPEEFEFEHRNIISCGDSIKISVSNKPIKSVRVNPVNSAGTGRVGPRQKPRLSYSSQSEDEKEMLAPIIRRRTHANQNEPTSSTNEDASKKPPLPPRGSNSSPKKRQVSGKTPFSVNREGDSPTFEKRELSRESSHENVSEGGDDSWEDVATTSGNESAEFSDADVARKPDEDGMADREETKNVSKIEDKTITKMDEAAEEVDNVSAKDISEAANVEELANKKGSVPVRSEESTNQEVESTIKEEKLPNREEELLTTEGELAIYEEELTSKEEELAENKEESFDMDEELEIKNEENKSSANEEELSNKKEDEVAPNREEVKISKVVEEKATKTGEKKESIEEKGGTESLRVEEQVNQKVSSGGESLSETKSLEVEKNCIGESPSKVAEEHIKEKVDLVSDCKETGTDVFIERTPKEKVDVIEESHVPAEWTSKQEEGHLKNKNVESDLPELKVCDLEANDKVTGNEDLKVFKACEDKTDGNTQNMDVSDVQIEDSKEQNNHQESHGNNFHPVTKLEET